ASAWAAPTMRPTTCATSPAMPWRWASRSGGTRPWAGPTWAGHLASTGRGRGCAICWTRRRRRSPAARRRWCAPGSIASRASSRARSPAQREDQRQHHRQDHHVPGQEGHQAGGRQHPACIAGGQGGAEHADDAVERQQDPAHPLEARTGQGRQRAQRGDSQEAIAEHLDRPADGRGAVHGEERHQRAVAAGDGRGHQRRLSDVVEGDERREDGREHHAQQGERLGGGPRPQVQRDLQGGKRQQEDEAEQERQRLERVVVTHEGGGVGPGRLRRDGRHQDHAQRPRQGERHQQQHARPEPHPIAGTTIRERSHARGSCSGHARRRRGTALAVPEPVRRVFVLSTIAAGLAALAAAGGLLLPGLYRDNLWVTSAWRGNDLVTLAVAVPLLLGASIAARGSRRALLVQLGMLAYLVYGYAFYLFGAAFNRFFLVYVAIFSLSTVALLFAAHGADVEAVAREFRSRTPARLVAGWLLLTGGGLGAAWVAQCLE